MADFDTSDLWWLKDRPAESQAGWQLGAQMAAQNSYAKQLQRQQMMARMDLQKAKAISDTNRSKGMAEMAALLATVSSTNGWGDPTNRAKVWEIGGRYPEVFDHNMLNGVWKNFEAYDDRKLRQEQELRRISAEGETPQTKNLAAAREKELAAQGLDATNPEEAANLRKEAELLRSTITAPTETIEGYTDEAGHQQFRVVRGPPTPKDLTKPTTAVATKLQEGLLGAEKAIELGANAFNALTPEAVGVKGQFNKVVINEGLAQLFPGMAKGDVTEAQTLLGNFNEKAIAALTASGDKRVSDKDMQRFQRILPKLTAGESLENARKKIQTFLGEIRREARTDAKTLGKDVPDWALTQDEIIDRVQTGKMTVQQARELVRKYQIPQ